jgi:NAD(P)-dependent dehydrogenase (short-subunit alcohol dehydrogenase family)
MSKREVVVITGSSAGVGRATARLFAQRGAYIGLLARGRDGLAAAAREVEAAGGEAMVLPADVSDAAQVEAAAEAVEKGFGPIDIWINNAMVSVFSPIKEMTPEEFKRVTEVTYLGVVHGSLSALKRMLSRDRGVIVQVGSALAYRGIPLQAAYCGAKHAVQGFTDSLRCELLHDGSKVKVVEVHLPALNTPQFSWVKSRLPRKPQPVPPIFQPEVAADAILWAAQHDRAQVYVGWPTVKAIVGDKMASRLADWYLARNGYEAQQTNEPAEPHRPYNLWEPLTGDHGAHGEFDSRSSDYSIQFWLSKNRMWLAVAGFALTGAIIGLGSNKRAKSTQQTAPSNISHEALPSEKAARSRPRFLPSVNRSHGRAKTREGEHGRFAIRQLPRNS